MAAAFLFSGVGSSRGSSLTFGGRSMVIVVTLLLVTVAITTLLRLAGFSKKSAVFFGCIPWTITNLLSLSAFMVLRTPEGRVISKTEQLLTEMIPPIVVALIVAFLVRKKEPNKALEPTR